MRQQFLSGNIIIDLLIGFEQNNLLRQHIHVVVSFALARDAGVVVIQEWVPVGLSVLLGTPHLAHTDVDGEFKLINVVLDFRVQGFSLDELGTNIMAVRFYF